MSSKPKIIGRPTIFSAELAEKICFRIAEAESMRSVCRDKTMPDKRTLLRWLRDDPDFRTQYMTAKDAMADYWAEDIVDIADENKKDVNRARLRVDTRKWLMARMAPKKYGDRTTAELTGSISLSLADLVAASLTKPEAE